MDFRVNLSCIFLGKSFPVHEIIRPAAAIFLQPFNTLPKNATQNERSIHGILALVILDESVQTNFSNQLRAGLSLCKKCLAGWKLFDTQMHNFRLAFE
jgi:hypothetical protein